MATMPHFLEGLACDARTSAPFCGRPVLSCDVLLGLDALAFDLTLDEGLHLLRPRVDGSVLVDLKVHQRLEVWEVFVPYPSIAVRIAVEAVVALRDMATNREAAGALSQVLDERLGYSAALEWSWPTITCGFGNGLIGRGHEPILSNVHVIVPDRAELGPLTRSRPAEQVRGDPLFLFR